MVIATHGTSSTQVIKAMGTVILESTEESLIFYSNKLFFLPHYTDKGDHKDTCISM